MKFAGLKKNILLGLACNLLTINSLMAQEIPSRVNDGVTTAPSQRVKKSGYADLGLSVEQQKKLRELEKERRDMLKAVSEDKALEEGQRKARIRKINLQSETKRKAILTPEQNEQFRKNARQAGRGYSRQSAQGTVENNKKSGEGKDNNGLSRDSKKRTSNRKRGGESFSPNRNKGQFSAR